MDLLFPLLILFMIGMIFFSSRQRRKQQQQQEEMQNAIAVGDVVLLTSGLSGTVVDTDDEKTLDIEIAPEVITTWLRAAVREKLSSDADGVSDDAELATRDESIVAPTVVPSSAADETRDAGTEADSVSAGTTRFGDSRSS